MAEVTFVGDQGTYVLQLQDDLQGYVRDGYLVEWVPGVYEFTEEGLLYFTTVRLKSEGKI